jgi:hypothetical protein
MQLVILWCDMKFHIERITIEWSTSETFSNLRVELNIHTLML